MREYGNRKRLGIRLKPPELKKLTKISKTIKKSVNATVEYLINSHP